MVDAHRKKRIYSQEGKMKEDLIGQEYRRVGGCAGVCIDKGGMDDALFGRDAGKWWVEQARGVDTW